MSIFPAFAALVYLGLPAIAAAGVQGSICIPPLSTELYVEDRAATMQRDYSVKIGDGAEIHISTFSKPVSVLAALDKTHFVRTFADGKPDQSFKLSFAKEGSADLCLMLGGYMFWEIRPRRRTSNWCVCEPPLKRYPRIFIDAAHDVFEPDAEKPDAKTEPKPISISAAEGVEIDALGHTFKSGCKRDGGQDAPSGIMIMGGDSNSIYSAAWVKGVDHFEISAKNLKGGPKMPFPGFRKGDQWLVSIVCDLPNEEKIGFWEMWSAGVSVK